MRINTKCLWTLTISTFVSILTNNLGECKSTFLDGDGNLFTGDASSHDIADERLNSDDTAKITGNKRGWDSNFAVWGKRDSYDELSENTGDNGLSTAQLNPDKRKWSKFASWGKREMPIDASTEWVDPEIDNKRDVMTEPLKIDGSEWQKQSSADKRKWQALSTWGKRTFDNTLDEYSKRGWSGFTSWGKRDTETDINGFDKRKWQQFSSWGKRGDGVEPIFGGADKRKWSKFTSWGKRNFEPILEELKKRKWSKFTSWGKRSEMSDDLDADKRKWAKFTSWGKRDNGLDTDGELDTPEKRKWNRLAVWGKRSDDESNIVDKRNWAKFASWGKRPRNPKAWLALNTWGKRRWTGLTTWGKRSGDGFKAESLARQLLQLFDSNGDGALDIDELTHYIRTLMSLPSKIDAEVTL